MLLVKSLAVRLTLCSFTVSLCHAIMLCTWCWANKDDDDDISTVPGLGLGFIHFGLGLGLEKFLRPRPHSLWPRPRPWPCAKLASLTGCWHAQLSQRGHATLRVVGNFAKALEVIPANSKLHRWVGRKLLLAFRCNYVSILYRFWDVQEPPYLQLATSEMWCWSGGRGI